MADTGMLDNLSLSKLSSVTSCLGKKESCMTVMVEELDEVERDLSSMGVVGGGGEVVTCTLSSMGVVDGDGEVETRALSSIGVVGGGEVETCALSSVGLTMGAPGL